MDCLSNPNEALNRSPEQMQCAQNLSRTAYRQYDSTLFQTGAQSANGYDLPKLTISDDSAGTFERVGNVVGELAAGAVEQIVEHPWRVAGSAAIGAATAIGTALLSPGLAAAATVAGIGYAGYQLYQHAGDWLRAGDTLLNEEDHSFNEVEQARQTLRGVGAGATDIAASGAGMFGAGLIRRAASGLFSGGPAEPPAAGAAAALVEQAPAAEAVAVVRPNAEAAAAVERGAAAEIAQPGAPTPRISEVGNRPLPQLSETQFGEVYRIHAEEGRAHGRAFSDMLTNAFTRGGVTSGFIPRTRTIEEIARDLGYLK